jgi:hypothetical protein
MKKFVLAGVLSLSLMGSAMADEIVACTQVISYKVTNYASVIYQKGKPVGYQTHCVQGYDVDEHGCIYTHLGRNPWKICAPYSVVQQSDGCCRDTQMP